MRYIKSQDFAAMKMKIWYLSKLNTGGLESRSAVILNTYKKTYKMNKNVINQCANMRVGEAQTDIYSIHTE